VEVLLDCAAACAADAATTARLRAALVSFFGPVRGFSLSVVGSQLRAECTILSAAADHALRDRASFSGEMDARLAPDLRVASVQARRVHPRDGIRAAALRRLLASVAMCSAAAAGVLLCMTKRGSTRPRKRLY
jgi:hypothetical protein